MKIIALQGREKLENFANHVRNLSLERLYKKGLLTEQQYTEEVDNEILLIAEKSSLFGWVKEKVFKSEDSIKLLFAELPEEDED